MLQHHICEKINNKYYYIRPLRVSDCLGSELPVCLYKISKSKSTHERMREELGLNADENNDSSDNTENLRKLLDICIGGVSDTKNSKYPTKFDFDKELIESENLVYFLYIKVLEHTYINQDVIDIDENGRIILKIIEINKNNALTIDKMAKRYGKTPAEIAFRDANITEYSAYSFNIIVCQAGNSDEISTVKRNKMQGVYAING